MKLLFIKYKSVLRFIFTFLLVYMIFSLGYKMYLQFSDGTQFYPDYFTHLVSIQTEHILQALNYNAQVIPHPDEPSMKVMLDGIFLARIIEGCNGISVIILFLSFIVAFSGKLKSTLIYILFGSILVYTFNLFRIVLLTIGLHRYPEYETILHTVIFPGIIYGTVFTLWVFWVNRFSKIKEKS